MKHSYQHEYTDKYIVCACSCSVHQQPVSQLEQITVISGYFHVYNPRKRLGNQYVKYVGRANGSTKLQYCGWICKMMTFQDYTWVLFLTFLTLSPPCAVPQLECLCFPHVEKYINNLHHFLFSSSLSLFCFYSYLMTTRAK